MFRENFVNCNFHETFFILRMNLNTEITREMHDFYIESARESLKNIIK